MDRQSALSHRPRPRKVALSVQHESKFSEARRRVGMPRAKHFLADRQRTLTHSPRLRQVALFAQQLSKVIEARRRVRMFRTEHLLADRQRPLEQWAGVRIRRERVPPVSRYQVKQV